jgi:peroxiredoxin
MAINAGDRMPDGAFGIMTESGPDSISTDELFSGKKVVLVSVPGAFTPTCSARHLPGFVEHADAILAKGVDTIAFTAVNDVFVMHAWSRDSDCGDKIMMLADGNVEYVKALGLDADSSAWGMGVRGQRFALVIDDGIVSHAAIESPGQFDVSSAEAILEAL